MFMARAPAEMEPKAAIFSSSSILPGPILPSGSRFIRSVRDGMPSNSFRILDIMQHTGTGQVFLVEGNRLYYGENGTPDDKPERLLRLAGNARQHAFAI